MDRPTLLLRATPHRAPPVRPGDRAATGVHAPGPAPNDDVARARQLQRLVGNRATANLVTSPVVQRLSLGGVVESLLRGVASITDLGAAALSVLADVAAGVEPSAAVVRQLLRAGVSEGDVTDLVLFARHPELGGRKLGEGDTELIAEWKSIRATLVRPQVRELEEARRRRAEQPPTTGGGTPAEPAAPAGGGGSGFLTDTDRSYLATLPGGEKYLDFDWHPLDYPGKKVKITDTSADNLDKLRADRQIVLYEKGGAWYIKGANQDMAKKLFAFLAKRVPERRANTGTHAVLTKKEFAKNPAMYDAYIISQLAAIPSQSGLRLNRHAAATFDAMVQAAAADGVQLRVSNSFRDRKKAEKNAAKAGNSAAVAGYSSHSLGLAVDLLLHTAATKGEWTETSTRMDNLVDMYRAPAYKWLAEHAAAHGWYPFRNEPWHWEYNPEGFREKFFAELDATHRPGD